MMQLDRIVRAAGASLAESLNYYWPPTNADVMALERNISLHMAHAFRAAGQLVYGEVNAATDRANRYDFLAIDPVQKRFMIAEFKRLDTRQSATRLVRDWRRLQRFRLQRSATHQHPLLRANPPVRWVLLAGITSSLDLARWFNTTNPNQWDPWSTPAANGPLDAIWAADWEQRFNAGTLYIDAVPLADWHAPDDTRRTHWLVYVFARA
jgi:hypothetical protein